MDKPQGTRRRKARRRVMVLLVLCCAVFALFLARLAWLQFAMADHYAQKMAEASSASYTLPQHAARGAITDRSGTVLAQDETVYDVYLRVPAPPGTNLRETVNTIAALTGGKDVETQLAAFCSAVSAGELPVTQGLDSIGAAAYYRAGLVQSGAVRLAARGVRRWPDGTILPHTLGFTGPITAEQWPAARAQGLAMDATIGQNGLEAAYDTLLRGRDGQLQINVGLDGVTRETVQTSTPVPGCTLVLTLDADLQKTLQTALQNQMDTLRTTKGIGAGREVRAGAAVVVDVRTGGILAAASLPDFDLSRYRSDYAALSADSAAPLLDRVCQGLYAPGSAFKPAVAAAALTAGIDPAATVTCTGKYFYYSNYHPGCLQYGHRGPVDLRTALEYSCNIFFYDTGRRLGVDTFSAMARQLGLANDTGVEITAAQGRLTWSTDTNYQDGLTLMAAIGQGNTAVTPLQLAQYAAALANYGTITKEMVSRLGTVTLDADTFDMVKLLTSGQTDKAQQKLKTLLALQNEPIMITGALISNYLDLYRVLLGRRSRRALGDVAKDFGYKGNWNYRLNSTEKTASRFKRAQMEDCLHILQRLDTDLKSSKLDADLLMQKALCELALAGRT